MELYTVAQVIFKLDLMISILQSSYPKCSVENGVLKCFTNFTERHLCWSLFLIKLQDWRPQHRCFPVKFGTFLKTSILKNICEQLLLNTVGTWRDFWVEDDSHPTDFYRTICLLYVHQIFIMFLSYIFILPFLSFFYHIFLSYLSINFSVFLFYQRESFWGVTLIFSRRNFLNF